MERNNDSDYTRATSDYEPNFILKEPEDAQVADDALRRAIDPLKDASIGGSAKATEATSPEAVSSETSQSETVKPESSNPETPRSEIPKPETPKKNAGSGSTTDTLDKDFWDAFTKVRPSKPEDRVTSDLPKEKVFSMASEETAMDPADRPTSDLPKVETPNTETPKMGEAKAPASRETEAVGIGADGPQARHTVVQPGKPLFENPSYTDGTGRSEMGRFTDPRDNFRTGASASWQGAHRDRSSYDHTSGRSGGDMSGPGASYNGPGTAHKVKTKKKSKPVTMSKKALGLLIAGCLLLSCLFGFGGAMVGYNLYDSYSKEQAQTTSSGTTTAAKTETAGYDLESATGSNMSVKQITATAKDSVVEIRTEGVVSDSWMQEYVTEGAGSGVIISEDGYIMTNNHVISGANKIKVTTSDEKEYEAKLVGTDENNDVAVIKIDATGLKAATYGNSDELEVGDLAVAIGNPLGELGGTVTAGIISAKDRALSIDGKTLHLLQTDSSINPGNSGGGLFNDSGQLIGLVVAKSAGSDVEGLGFAIPVNTAANVAQQLMDKGYVSGQPSTGMTYQEGSAGGSGFGSFESMFGSSSQSQVYIYSVNGNNAKKAGFKSGDIVLAIDDEEITSFNDLSAIVTSHKVGDTITFTISRDGNEKKIKLELEEKKVSTNPDQDEDTDQDTEEGIGGGATEDGPGEGPSDGNQDNEFPSAPEDEGGSLFDYFFGW